ncbi:hypothetical protein N9Z38_00435 [Mariniblastus sp.]|nr:hypothetical protein [Mariniblastus sp.]
MENSQRLTDYYLPPADGFILESLVATTYQVDFEFFEEELLAVALGVRSPISRMRAFRSELERRLQKTDISVLYDLAGCPKLTRLSPRIDPIPIVSRKLHSKISLLMWVREERDGDKPPDRLLRLIVGSANLTRPGFRNNYECFVSIDFGGRNTSPRALLVDAIQAIRQISDASQSKQLERQLDFFANQASNLPTGETSSDQPLELVVAEQVLSTLKTTWESHSESPPQKLTIVSPFWTTGKTAADALENLVERLGSPNRVDLICKGAPNHNASEWLPEFDSEIATELKKRLEGRLFLRAALPDFGVNGDGNEEEDIGEETEDSELGKAINTVESGTSMQRSLHAKMILLDGPSGSVLYAGSSNCTRRGLGLGGPANSEAGFIYQLSPKQRRQFESTLSFAGPATEVLLEKPPKTSLPPKIKENPVPRFLSEVTAEGSVVTISFREGAEIPNDLVLLMEIPQRLNELSYWLLYQHDVNKEEPRIVADLKTCLNCDKDLIELPPGESTEEAIPHVFVEVRWNGNVATYPVRFDDKAKLPLLLIGRKPTEDELIEYFLFGREPGDGGDGGEGGVGDGKKNDAPVDTSRILAYFIRRFVQAIPGIEAELLRASYSQTALDSALRGPTSPLELAERAFASLSARQLPNEPVKTATAVGFQIVEIVAALTRSRDTLNDDSLKACYDPVIGRCRELIEELNNSFPELKEGAFRSYQNEFVGSNS